MGLRACTPVFFGAFLGSTVTGFKDKRREVLLVVFCGCGETHCREVFRVLLCVLLDFWWHWLTARIQGLAFHRWCFGVRISGSYQAGSFDSLFVVSALSTSRLLFGHRACKFAAVNERVSRPPRLFLNRL